MRMAILIGAAAAALATMSAPEARAQDYPYCAVAGGRDAYETCGYTSLRQCLAAVSGVGGHCQPNPRFGAATGYGPSYGYAERPRYHQRRHSHRRADSRRHRRD